MQIFVKKNHELRFEVKDIPLKIMIKFGHCEIKGQELLLNKWYTFIDIKTFIFSHIDSEIETDRDCDDWYISNDTNTLQILRLFSILMQNSDELNFKLKGTLEDKNTFVVLGKGKSTFIQTIVNYFVRCEKNVLVTELSPNTGFILFEGCMVSNLCTKLIDCVDGLSLENPLVYFYGSSRLEYNSDFYNEILKNLNAAIEKKDYDFHFILANEEILNKKDYFGGLDSCKIVLKDEKLYNKLGNDKIYISGGAYEEKKAMNKLFLWQNSCTSYSTKTKASVVRIGEEFLAPETALPIGEDRKIEKNVIMEVKPRKNMVLGVSFAEESTDIIKSPIKTFVIVNEIGDGFLKVMSPQPNLKCNFLIQGELYAN